MRLIIPLLTSLMMASCTSDYGQNLQGKQFDANAPICQQLRNESVAVFRNAQPTDTTSYDSQNFPMGFVSISDLERDSTKDRYSSSCETPSQYNKRTKLQLRISQHL